MADTPDPASTGGRSSDHPAPIARATREAAALRDNLRRRKQQQRGREGASPTPEASTEPGLEATTHPD